MNKRVSVGIAGLGRSGWNIHAETLAGLDDMFELRAVCDNDHDRRAEAIERFGCSAYSDFGELVADPNVELIVVSTPTHLHSRISIDALRAGKHVLVEKPMAEDVTKADQMIAAARESDRVLTVFQSRRFEADVQKILEVIESGVLGMIVEVRTDRLSFARRWDWQTMKQFHGGLLNNNGAHIVDQALLFFDDPEPDVFCRMESTELYAGDAESHLKVILTPKAGPIVEVNSTNGFAFPQNRWMVMGTHGSLIGDSTKVSWKYFDPSELEPMTLDPGPALDRKYSREELPWREESWTFVEDKKTYGRIYRSVHGAIRDGTPPLVTPESVRRQILVLDKCRSLSPV